MTDLAPLSITFTGKAPTSGDPLALYLIDKPQPGTFAPFTVAERGAFRALMTAALSELDREEES